MKGGAFKLPALIQRTVWVKGLVLSSRLYTYTHHVRTVHFQSTVFHALLSHASASQLSHASQENKRRGSNHWVQRPLPCAISETRGLDFETKTRSVSGRSYQQVTFDLDIDLHMKCAENGGPRGSYGN